MVLLRPSYFILFAMLFVSGCVSQNMCVPGFEYVPITAGGYEIATWQRITDRTAPVHIYIEGDGNAFDAMNFPTNDPTPRGRAVRDLAARDAAPNVVYVARPCQFIKSARCTPADWTHGRFSANIVDAMAAAVHAVAGGRPVVLVGYSGGAMISGLILIRHPEIKATRWITVAGVLNHSQWTAWFGDSPLTTSLDMDVLPQIKQTHYVAENDAVVPRELSQKWTGGAMQVIPGAKHDKLDNLNIEFDKL